MQARVPIRFVSSWLVVCALAVGASAQTGQFGPFVQSHGLDNVQGEVVNLETELIEPVLWLDDLGLLCVINEPDNRIVYLTKDLSPAGETVVGQGAASLARNPGTNELWVTMNGHSGVVMIDLPTREVIDFLRPPIDPALTGAGAAAAPGDVAFSDGRAFVTASFADAVVVYDALTRNYLGTIELKHAHNGRLVDLNEPSAVIAYAGKIWVLSRLSGNNTTSRIAGGLDISDPGVTDDDLGPDQVSIVNLDQEPNLSLPDFDIACINPLAPFTDPVEAMVTGVGTVLFGLEADPVADRLIISNTEARNDEFIGEEAFPNGQVVFNRLTFVDPTTRTVTGIKDMEFLGAAQVHSVMPTDMLVMPDGAIAVAGYCSENIVVLDGNLNLRSTVVTPPGPRGLAYSAVHNKLFCLNRAAGSVTSYDVTPSTLSLGDTFVLSDPTFDCVKEGRIEFLKANSGAGTTNCASCHMDGRKDGVAWNLSKTMAPNPTQPIDFRDRKGVMITQDLRGLVGIAPYHWRGEQKDLDDFNGAFEELLHGTRMDHDSFQKMKDYIFSLEYPPNPDQQMNRGLSAPAIIGHAEYGNSDTTGTCARCHALPHGTNCDIGCGILGDTHKPTTVKVAQFRGLWTRMSDLVDIDPDPVEVEEVRAQGYGVLHEGVVDGLQEFVDHILGPNGLNNPAEVIQFIEELDSAMAPAAAYADKLDSTTANGFRADHLELYLLPQATVGNCDVAGRGWILENAVVHQVGLYFDTGNQVFLADNSTLGPYTFDDLETKAANGEACLLIMGTPYRSGQRIGVDRDRDGVFDTDEVLAGLDPKNPDTDGDGYWDSEDPQPLNGGVHFVSNEAPEIVPGSVEIIMANTNCIKVGWTTTRFSRSILQFGLQSNDEWEWGDGDLGGGGNHWKKHHVGFIRPIIQEDPDPSLTILRPDETYNFRIVTKGQNGVMGFYDQGNSDTFPNNGNHFFRGDGLKLVRNYKAPNGNLVYAVEATFSQVQGSPTIDGKDVPGRFILYDSTGDNYSYVTQKATISNGSAIFVLITPSGPQHDAGDRWVFDMPMWVILNEGTPQEEPALFPGKAQWSDSVTAIEAVSAAGT